MQYFHCALARRISIVSALLPHNGEKIRKTAGLLVCIHIPISPSSISIIRSNMLYHVTSCAHWRINMCVYKRIVFMRTKFWTLYTWKFVRIAKEREQQTATEKMCIFSTVLRRTPRNSNRNKNSRVRLYQSNVAADLVISRHSQNAVYIQTNLLCVMNKFVLYTFLCGYEADYRYRILYLDNWK